MGRTPAEGTVACGPVPAGVLVVAVEVVALLASPQHAYEGRPVTARGPIRSRPVVR